MPDSPNPGFVPRTSVVFPNLVRVAREFQAAEFRSFVSAVLVGRFVPDREFVSTPPIEIGAVLRATDRDYVMSSNGSYRRATPKRAYARDRKESNVFCPHWPVKNKYPKVLTAPAP